MRVWPCMTYWMYLVSQADASCGAAWHGLDCEHDMGSTCNNLCWRLSLMVQDDTGQPLCADCTAWWAHVKNCQHVCVTQSSCAWWEQVGAVDAAGHGMLTLSTDWRPSMSCDGNAKPGSVDACRSTAGCVCACCTHLLHTALSHGRETCCCTVMRSCKRVSQASG